MSRYIIVIVDFSKIGAIIADKMYVYYSISMFSMKEGRKKERILFFVAFFSRHFGVPFLDTYVRVMGTWQSIKCTPQQTFEVSCLLLSTRITETSK
jgi:hypothetical protein